MNLKDSKVEEGNQEIKFQSKYEKPETKLASKALFNLENSFGFSFGKSPIISASSSIRKSRKYVYIFSGTSNNDNNSNRNQFDQNTLPLKKKLKSSSGDILGLGKACKRDQNPWFLPAKSSSSACQLNWQKQQNDSRIEHPFYREETENKENESFAKEKRSRKFQISRGSIKEKIVTFVSNGQKYDDQSRKFHSSPVFSTPALDCIFQKSHSSPSHTQDEDEIYDSHNFFKKSTSPSSSLLLTSCKTTGSGSSSLLSGKKKTKKDEDFQRKFLPALSLFLTDDHSEKEIYLNSNNKKNYVFKDEKNEKNQESILDDEEQYSPFYDGALMLSSESYAINSNATTSATATNNTNNFSDLFPEDEDFFTTTSDAFLPSESFLLFSDHLQESNQDHLNPNLDVNVDKHVDNHVDINEDKHLESKEYLLSKEAKDSICWKDWIDLNPQ